jgi:hypothetical protein
MTSFVVMPDLLTKLDCFGPFRLLERCPVLTGFTGGRIFFFFFFIFPDPKGERIQRDGFSNPHAREKSFLISIFFRSKRMEDFKVLVFWTWVWVEKHLSKINKCEFQRYKKVDSKQRGKFRLGQTVSVRQPAEIFTVYLRIQNFRFGAPFSVASYIKVHFTFFKLNFKPGTASWHLPFSLSLRGQGMMGTGLEKTDEDNPETQNPNRGRPFLWPFRFGRHLGR